MFGKDPMIVLKTEYARGGRGAATVRMKLKSLIGNFGTENVFKADDKIDNVILDKKDCIAWAFYTWLLSRSTGPQEVKSHWASFLIAQITFGLLWSGLFTGGEALLGGFRFVAGWPLLGTLLFIAIGPAILAYRFWSMGVQRATPAIAGFFGNLIPLFTALLSIPVLGETPHLYHVLAFALIVAGIVVSSRK